MSFRSLDHTGDIGFVARAPSLDELFGEAASAFTDCITPVAGVGRAREVAITLEAPDLELLLVAFLEELLHLFEIERFLAGQAAVAVEEGEPARLKARLQGERLDPERHPVTVAIKAVTYHGLEVRREGDHWRAQVILDI